MSSLSPPRPPHVERLTEFEALVAAGPNALNAIPGAIYLCDKEGKLVCYNREAMRLWGRAPVIGDGGELYCGSYRLYRPDGTFLPHDQCPMATAVREGVVTQNAEVVIERTDGTRLTALVNIHPLFDDKGNIEGAINCFHDISARKALEKELDLRNADLEDFFENTAMAMHIVDHNGIVVRANQAELELLGYAEDEYVGRPIASFHADAPVIADILARLARGESLLQYPARLLTRDGQIRHVQISSSARFVDGKFANSRCCTVDVTRQKQMEDEIRNAERQLRELLEALPAAVYTTDAQGRITFYNQAAAELAGREPVLGTDEWCVTWRLYHPDGRPLPHDECPMAVCLKEGRPVRGEQAIAERPDGTRVPFMPYPTPLRDAQGKVVGAINMLVDITPHKQAEERQKALIDELNHRVKNTLATVQSLVRRTARHASTLQDFAATLEARIIALARAHDLLSKRYWVGVPMETLVRDIVAPYADNDGKLRIAGPSVQLNPRAALSLTMALNELTTNAAKYGALRGAAGGVGIEWKTGAGDAAMLELEWVEQGGPPVTEPPRRGFGTGLMERCIERDLNGRCDLRFSREGVQCLIAIPLKELTVHE